jgi:hypothetical protein
MGDEHDCDCVQTPGFNPFMIYGPGRLSDDSIGRQTLSFVRDRGSVSLSDLEWLVGQATGGRYDADYKQHVSKGLWLALIEQGAINESGEVNQAAFQSQGLMQGQPLPETQSAGRAVASSPLTPLDQRRPREAGRIPLASPQSVRGQGAGSPTGRAAPARG